MSFFKKRLQASRFFLGEQAGNEPVTLTHRCIFILPTKRGLGFVLLLIVLLLIAFIYNNNLVYLLTFLLTSVYFITILHCFKMLSGLIVQPGGGKPVFAGDKAAFVIHIINPTPVYRSNLAIAGQSSGSFSIQPNGKTQATIFSKTQKRGWHEAGVITLASVFPLGLFRAWSPLRFQLKVLVYPKPAQAELPLPAALSASHANGNFHTAEGDDFIGLQEYRSGDSIKRIHWKAFAKGQGLFIKQYRGGSPAQIWLDYNDAPGHSVEERLSHLCRWVLDADKAGVAFGFSLPGLKLAPDCSERHTRKCLEALALF